MQKKTTWSLEPQTGRSDQHPLVAHTDRAQESNDGERRPSIEVLERRESRRESEPAASHDDLTLRKQASAGASI